MLLVIAIQDVKEEKDIAREWKLEGWLVYSTLNWVHGLEMEESRKINRYFGGRMNETWK